MTTYSYRARDLNGLLIMGSVEAENADVIRFDLAEKGLIPVDVSMGQKIASREIMLDLFNHVKNEEVMLFTRQFHTLFKAGMDMENLFATLAKQTKCKPLSEAILRMRTDVSRGSSLANAFRQHPKIFNELYCNMIATGEEAGILEKVLAQLSDLLEKEVRLKSSVKSATLYPKIVICVLLMATVVIMTIVMPKFASFYAHYDAELPLPTKLLMGASNLTTSYWYLVLLLLVSGMMAFKKWVTTPTGKYQFDEIKWKIPVVGQLSQKVANARFANILGSLYQAGIPVIRALEITSRTINHEGFYREIMGVQAEVKKGRSIADAMRRSSYFSPLLIESTAIGEKSGSLDQMYASIGEHYDMEVQHTLKNLTTLIEPILLFLIFGMVAMFMLAVFLPMWNFSGVVLNH